MRRWTALAVVGGATIALVAPGLAVPSTRPRVTPAAGQDPAAVRLLVESVSAPQRHSYRGTQVAVVWSPSGDSTALVDVWHRAGRDTVVRVLPTASSVDTQPVRAEGGRTEQLALDLLVRNFEARVETSATVAGRLADVLTVQRPGRSPVARLWLDRQTRIPLRREVYDADGRLLRASAFIDIALTEPGPDVPTAIDAPEVSGSLLAETEVEQLREDGWAVPGALPGGLQLLEARTAGAGDERVVHASYSDGISALSLFVQRGELDRGSLDGWEKASLGGAKVYEKHTYPRRIVWSGEGMVFTLVAECQQPMLEEVVRALPHSEPDTGLAARLGRGVRRVGSWFNPFG
jgi:hypothetical protein